MANISLIFSEYEESNERNKRELEKRKEKTYNQLPRLLDIEKEMIRLGLDMAKAYLTEERNKEKYLADLQKRQSQLNEEKLGLLLSNNYPRDYLELKYDCDKCKDTGYIGLQKCTCFIQKQIKHNHMQANLGASKEDFDHFNIEYYSDVPAKSNLSPRKNMQQIFLECIKYVHNFDCHNNNMLFIGRPGLGKTFLCKSIAKELLQSGKSVIYQSAPDLMDLVRKYKYNFDKEDEGEEALNDINECDLLIIDDLGTELSTQFSGLVIYNILNKRLINSKKMIVATNLDVNEILRDYSERITSRLFGKFRMFEFFGDDIRLMMK